MFHWGQGSGGSQRPSQGDGRAGAPGGAAAEPVGFGSSGPGQGTAPPGAAGPVPREMIEDRPQADRRFLPPPPLWPRGPGTQKWLSDVCYQAVARWIGVERMTDHLDRFGYAAMAGADATLDRFRLEAESTVSPRDQMEFLRRLLFSELPIQTRTEGIIERLMVLEEGEHWTLSGRTGWVSPEEQNPGWFVGTLETADGVFFKTTRATPRDRLEVDPFSQTRSEGSLEALRAIGTLPSGSEA